MPIDTAYAADYLKSHRDEILARWRLAAKSQSEQSRRLAELDDSELLDHIPAITDALILSLHGEASSKIEDDSRRHGHQRRLKGYSVIDVLWELTIFRRVFLAILHDASNAIEEQIILEGRHRILDLMDLCARASIDQFIQETETERNIASARAANLELQRQRFLGTLSHELRNQVQPILFAVQLLKDASPAAQQLHAIEVIERQTRHQAFLLDDLLDLHRVRFGKLELNVAEIDVRECIMHGVEANQAAADAKKLRVEANLPGDPVLAMADRSRLSQATTNLMANAVKFTPDGGAIVWRVARESEWQVISIRDTGIGIKPEDLEQIFDIFFQAEIPPQVNQQGLGIGLTVVKNLVELSGGKIEAKSGGDGQGTEFILRIPVPGGSA
jgi:signal transduction histidine kinase